VQTAAMGQISRSTERILVMVKDGPIPTRTVEEEAFLKGVPLSATSGGFSGEGGGRPSPCRP